MYRTDETVSHPAYGACVIKDVLTRDFSGIEKEYYLLSPHIDPTAAVYVPVEKADLIGLRRLITEAEADHLLDFLGGAGEVLASDALAKQRRYKTLFDGNDKSGLFDFVSVMGALIKRRSQKELGSVDKSMLETIQNRVMSEIACAKNMPFSSAVHHAEAIVLNS